MSIQERTESDEIEEIEQVIEDHDVRADSNLIRKEESDVWMYTVCNDDEAVIIQRKRTVGGDYYNVIHAYEIHSRTDDVLGSTMEHHAPDFLGAKIEFRDLIQKHIEQ
jgi:hypothetical protein